MSEDAPHRFARYILSAPMTNQKIRSDILLCGNISAKFQSSLVWWCDCTIGGGVGSRRNLSPDDFKLIIGRIYNRTKKTDPFKGNQHVKAGGVQNEHHQKPERTASVIAKEHNVSESTVRRAGKLAEAAETIQKENPDMARDEVIKKLPQQTESLPGHLKRSIVGW